MRTVKCYDCGKVYNFDVDDFCPRCGAFTQPKRQSRINEAGEVVRVDGMNERNHQASFVHEELHAEERKRKGTVLETKKPEKPVMPLQPLLRPKSIPGKKNPPVIGWVILAVVLYNLFMILMFSM